MTTKKEAPAKAQAKTAAQTAKTGAEQAGLGSPSLSAVEAARNEGVTEAIKEDAKEAYQFATDGRLPGEAPARQFVGYDEVQQYAHLLGLGAEAFAAAVAEDAPSPIPEEKVYGLLAMERNGQNRTPYVKAAMARLDLKANELPGGGPSYTNDVRPISEL